MLLGGISCLPAVFGLCAKVQLRPSYWVIDGLPQLTAAGNLKRSGVVCAQASDIDESILGELEDFLGLADVFSDSDGPPAAAGLPEEPPAAAGLPEEPPADAELAMAAAAAPVLEEQEKEEAPAPVPPPAPPALAALAPAPAPEPLVAEPLLAALAPPPPAAARGRGGRGRGRGRAAAPYEYASVEDEAGRQLGRILVNIHPMSMSVDGHCSTCGARINRQFLAHASRPFHRQGRPVGSLVAWLRRPCGAGHRDAYFTIPHAERLDARRWAMGHGPDSNFSLILNRERPQRDDEPSEEPLEVS